MPSSGVSQEGTDAAGRSSSQAAKATARLQYTVAQRMKEAGELSTILLSRPQHAVLSKCACPTGTAATESSNRILIVGLLRKSAWLSLLRTVCCDVADARRVPNCHPWYLCPVICNHLYADTLPDATGTGKVAKVKKGTWLDQTKARQELGRKPLSAHQQRQLAHTAAGRLHGSIAD